MRIVFASAALTGYCAHYGAANDVEEKTYLGKLLTGLTYRDLAQFALKQSDALITEIEKEKQ